MKGEMRLSATFHLRLLFLLHRWASPTANKGNGKIGGDVLLSPPSCWRRIHFYRKRLKLTSDFKSEHVNSSASERSKLNSELESEFGRVLVLEPMEPSKPNLNSESESFNRSVFDFW